MQAIELAQTPLCEMTVRRIHYMPILRYIFDPAKHSLCHNISAQRQSYILGTHNKTFTINFKFVNVFLFDLF